MDPNRYYSAKLVGVFGATQSLSLNVSELEVQSMSFRYSTTSSSICSMTSSTQTSISSFSSLVVWLFKLFCSPSSFFWSVRHAFHSSTSRLRRAMSSALTLLSSAASSSSNARLYSRRFLRTCLCFSFVNRLIGRGRQINCLNLSCICFISSCPRKSQIAKPFSS